MDMTRRLASGRVRSAAYALDTALGTLGQDGVGERTVALYDEIDSLRRRLLKIADELERRDPA